MQITNAQATEMLAMEWNLAVATAIDVARAAGADLTVLQRIAALRRATPTTPPKDVVR